MILSMLGAFNSVKQCQAKVARTRSNYIQILRILFDALYRTTRTIFASHFIVLRRKDTDRVTYPQCSATGRVYTLAGKFYAGLRGYGCE